MEPRTTGVLRPTARCCRWNRVVLLAAVLFLLVLADRNTALAASAGGVASPWTAWLGCWELLSDTIEPSGVDEEAVPSNAEPGVSQAVEVGPPPPAERRLEGARICFTPSTSRPGITERIFARGRVIENGVAADGTSRSFASGSCRGSRREVWVSRDRWISSHAELACTAQSPVLVDGVSMLTPGPVWLDVQRVESEGGTRMRVRRYRRAEDQSGAVPFESRAEYDAALRVTETTRVTLDDVKSMHRVLGPDLLQALLVETASIFPLNGGRLLDLSRAGVSSDVIDLMVALSFRTAFSVEPVNPPAARHDSTGPADAEGWAASYAPFVYELWARSIRPWHEQGGWVTVRGKRAADDATEPAGYARVRRVIRPSRQASDGSDSGYDGDSSSDGASGDSSDSSSGGSVSPDGYSSSPPDR